MQVIRRLEPSGRRGFGLALAAIGLLLALDAPAEELRFAGSFWDHGDSFLMNVDLGRNPKAGPATLHWSGFRENKIDRKKLISRRITLDVELSPEETRPLRSLVEQLPLCHSGHNMVLGTGLSVSAATWKKDDYQSGQSYFHAPQRALHGRRMRDLPLRFQELAADGRISQEEKKQWLAEVADFVEDLSGWREALRLLEEARQSGNAIPWEEIEPRILRERPDLTDTPFIVEIPYVPEAAPVIDCLLAPENRAEYFPELGDGRIVVRLDEITQHDGPPGTWIGFPALPPRDFAGESDQWAILPPETLLFLEDFLVGASSESGPQFAKSWERIEHPIWDIPSPAEEREAEFEERLAFLESCGWEARRFGQDVPVGKTGHLRIFHITFHDNLMRCVVLTHRAGEPRFTLLEVKNAAWTILRQVDHEDWEEHGFREPLFK